jgi:hypothetical protein
MRATALVSVMLLASTLAVAAPTSPEVWVPIRPYIGKWSGTRTVSNGTVKVTRTYSQSGNNQHLQVLEKNGSDSGVWGVISYDTEQQQLVLRLFGQEGRAVALKLDPDASTGDDLVFDGVEGAPRMRIVYDRTGWNDFVERIEHSDVGGNYSVVTETRFKRAD